MNPSAEALERVRRLILEILPANAFQAARLRREDFETPLDAVRFAKSVPFTTKADLVADQAANPPFGSNLTFPLDRCTRFCQTSGTSGAPLRWLDTPESWDWMVQCKQRVLERSGIGAGDRVLFAFSFGPFLGFWLGFEAAARAGRLCLPGGGLSTAARLQMLRDNRATVLCCTPTYAIRLGEEAGRTGMTRDLAVRIILVAGEPGAGIPEVRRRIESLWPGAALKDHHGMTEIGPVSYECPARPGTLHAMADAYVAEVVRPDGSPCEPGEQGELVLTNLGRTASPLLRYRTGDLVTCPADEACACGTTDPAYIGGILGRVDDMAIVRGVNLHPSSIEAVIRRTPSVAEYRVELFEERGMREIEVLIEAEGGAIVAEEVESNLRDAFHLRIPVRAVSSDSLPRFEFKARRWVRR